MNKDIVQWDSARLTEAILQADESNMPRLRAMILHAEDTHFTVEEDAKLSPWLLNFAERHKPPFSNSGYSDSVYAVWSAIRTGASMLFPKDAGNLCSLLQPGQSTSNVAMKMLGRIFESQPPTDIDQHIDLANDVLQMLNQHVITTQNSSEVKSALYTIQTIYAIVAMGGSSTIDRITEILKKYDAWTIRRLCHKLLELQGSWSIKATVSENVMEFLKQVLNLFSGIEYDRMYEKKEDA